jgi:hypothetical protein
MRHKELGVLGRHGGIDHALHRVSRRQPEQHEQDRENDKKYDNDLKQPPGGKLPQLHGYPILMMSIKAKGAGLKAQEKSCSVKSGTKDPALLSSPAMERFNRRDLIIRRMHEYTFI